MSALSTPFGLRPSYHPSGIIRPSAGTITSGLAGNIFHQAPVKVDATSGDIIAATAGAANNLVGCFHGVEYNNQQQRRTVGNWWPSGTIGGAAFPGTVVYYSGDPWLVYAIQANGAVARSMLGKIGSFTAQSGDTGTGLSTVMLDIATLAAAADQLQIVGITRSPDNDWGDAFTVVDVQIANHQFVGPRPALA
jgi:hypothetical protein